MKTLRSLCLCALTMILTVGVFFDLVRWGIAADVMNKYIAKEEASRVYYQGAQFTSDRDEYLPITNNQYKFSGKNYVQNPGYAAF